MHWSWLGNAPRTSELRRIRCRLRRKGRAHMTIDVTSLPKIPAPWFARWVMALHRGLAVLRRSLLPPQLYLFELGTALWTAQCVHSVARLGIAQRLAHGPATADELAAGL